KTLCGERPVLRSRWMAEEFSRDEWAALAPYVTNLDGPVFALVNLPEVVKGALFARYSRSPKSLRRLFLAELLGLGGLEAAGAGAAAGAPGAAAGATRAEQLRARVRRVRRRLGRPARRRAPGVRGGLEHPDQGARVGPAHGLSRAIHAL